MERDSCSLNSQRIQELEKELQDTKATLQVAVEELHTVNSELERKKEVLAQLLADHENLLNSTQEGIVFLDGALNIRKFNQAITRFLKLGPQDIGGSFDHVATGLETQHPTVAELQKVLATSTSLEKEVLTQDGHSLLIRIVPFQPSVPQTAGVILFIGDNSRIEQLQHEVQERQRMAKILQQRLHLESVVNSISSQFINVSVAYIDEQIKLSLAVLTEQIGMGCSCLCLLNEETNEFERYCSWPESPSGHCTVGKEITPYWYSQLERFQNVFVESVKHLSKDAQREKLWMQNNGVQSIVIVPLVYGGMLYGCLGIVASGSSDVQLLENVSFLQIVGEIFVNALVRKDSESKLEQYHHEVRSKSLALEVANAHIQDEIEKARRLHMNLLPKVMPKLAKYTVASYYHSAELLGGDFYNFYHIGNQLVFYLSDVTGHGLDAAIISVFVRNTISSFIAQKAEDDSIICPRELLAYFKQQYQQEQFPLDYFICLFIGVLNESTDELRYSSAGFQNAPLIVSGTEPVRELPCGGLLISGSIDPSLSEPKEYLCTIKEGDSLLFTTDGLPEQMVDKQMYESRLQRVFAKYAYLHPEWVIDFINNDFRSFTGSLENTDDDITFLVLQGKDSNRVKFSLAIPSSFDQVIEVQQRLATVFDAEEDLDMFQMAIHEMVVNAIEHGNKLDSAKQVVITVRTNDDYIQVDVEDQGVGFDWDQFLKAQFDSSSYHDRGRGIMMTVMAVDGIRYNARGNSVSLLKIMRDHS